MKVRINMMENIIDNRISAVKKLVNNYGLYVFVLSLYGFIAYFVSISNQLTNNIDAFWFGMYWYPNSCVLEEGRFSWWILGKMFCGLQMDAYTTIISFVIFAIGLSIVHKVLSDNKKPELLFYILSFLFISEVGVRSQLSYRFQGPYFALAFLFCMLGCAAVVFLKNNVMAVIMAVICFAIGMGFYQVDIGCAALVLLMNLLLILYKDNNLKQFWNHLFRDLFAGIIGVVIYIIIMKLFITISGVTMTGRIDENGLSITKIYRSAPQSVIRCYKSVFDYMFNCEWNNNVFQDNKLLYIIVLFLLAVGIFCLLLKMFKADKKIQCLFYVLLLTFIPIFANCSLFINPEIAISIQMMISICFVFPVYTYMLAVALRRSKALGMFIYKGVLTVCVAVLFYGSFFSLQIDQQAMYEGKNATTSMANQMIYDLTDMGYFDVPKEQRKPIAIMGSASSNDQFVVSDVFYKANRYARMGDFLFDCVRVSWESTVKYYCCRDIEFVDLSTYFKLAKSGDIKSMPKFPEDGYILEKDDMIILNVSIE